MTKWLLIMVTALGVAACDNKAPDKTADSSTATTVEQKADSQKVLDDALAMAPACEKGMVTVTTADGKEHTIAVEIAKTQEQQAYGLMFRKSVPQNTGMLFVWDTPNPVEFWMRNTLVSLDMLFIGPDHKIISIKKNATPRSDEHIPSGGDVIAVIEVLVGEADRLGIAVGDTVTWSEDKTAEEDNAQPTAQPPEDEAKN